MMPSELRDELLAQHESLCGHMEATCLAVRRWADSEVPQSHVRDELARLTDALLSHNRLEERTLPALIRKDALGPDRVEIMNEAHVREHHDLFNAIFALTYEHDARDCVSALDRLRVRLLEHIAREEESFLNPSVLRDEGGPREETAGR
jgi:hemerythrin HHE cation binding domain-containing protein